MGQYILNGSRDGTAGVTKVYVDFWKITVIMVVSVMIMFGW